MKYYFKTTRHELGTTWIREFDTNNSTEKILYLWLDNKWVSARKCYPGENSLKWRHGLKEYVKILRVYSKVVRLTKKEMFLIML